MVASELTDDVLGTAKLIAFGRQHEGQLWAIEGTSSFGAGLTAPCSDGGATSSSSLMARSGRHHEHATVRENSTAAPSRTSSKSRIVG